MLIALAVVGVTTLAVRSSAVPHALERNVTDFSKTSALAQTGNLPSNSTEASIANAPIVTEANAELARLWEADGSVRAGEASDLVILRRLSLALHGTIPSLEELRLFELDTSPDRINRWCVRLLQDNRFDDYFAERLARSYVGTEGGRFLVYRRDRFINWLTHQLRANRPYNEIVSAMISGTGVWTGQGEVNFLTNAFDDDEFNPNKITARTVRAFLGQRMDCAQCHDHPFDHWTQNDFEGIAAHFSQVRISPFGLTDDKSKEFIVDDGTTEDGRMVAPSVPFNPEWLSESEARRERLAAWVTHPSNVRFERATANHVWGLLFGRPYATDRPVDDLPDPGTDSRLAMLDLLGENFRENGYDLKHLIRVIVATDAFRMSSVPPETNGDEETPDNWSVFPLVRLRPEQVIGSMIQANNIRTVDQNSHLFIRALKFFRANDFVDEFGDPGAEELQDRAGTIPQALLRMNGELSRELTSMNPFFAPGRIAAIAPTPESQIETVYLCSLTRKPTPEELQHFQTMFEESGTGTAIEDLFWIMFNSPEFSWNH
ncbi:DUF1549 domain-containing protein [Thalassoglobus sp. JC818]|uniref:DUF1549 domain-containing protein n=1 Tax=Thalassoglobus sp. JC818 TaxID=3232136 RepID=UPI00345B3468